MSKSDWILFCVIYIPAAMAISFGLISCTISLQNIMTHGVANDLVDEELKSDAKIDATIKPGF